METAYPVFFAQHLIGNQEKHGIIHHLLIQFELLNPTVFNVYLTDNQSGCSKFMGHTSRNTVIAVQPCTLMHQYIYYVHEFVSAIIWKLEKELTKPIRSQISNHMQQSPSEISAILRYLM